MGRTESEAEEETAVDPNEEFIFPPAEDEEDVVEHPGIKPMWLLRFFTSWGARWGAWASEDGNASSNDGMKFGTSNTPSSTRTSIEHNEHKPPSPLSTPT
jgi:hypothetical protein